MKHYSRYVLPAIFLIRASTTFAIILAIRYFVQYAIPAILFGLAFIIFFSILSSCAMAAPDYATVWVRLISYTFGNGRYWV